VARRIESNATHSRWRTASGKTFRHTAVLWVFVALQGVGLARYCPCHLSYYNLLVGGLAGASRLGFEPTYWGETVREPLLAQAAWQTQDAAVLFLPNLAPFQAGGVQLNSPSLQESNITLVGLDEAAALSGRRFAIVYHRRADLAQAEQVLQEGALIAEYEIQGVWLARLLELPRKTSPPRRGVRES